MVTAMSQYQINQIASNSNEFMFQFHQASAEIQRLDVPEDLIDEVAAQVQQIQYLKELSTKVHLQ